MFPVTVVQEGGVISRTSTIVEHVALQLVALLTVSERVKELLQFAPAVTVTLDKLLGPVINPSPVMLQK
jgi:hypothetical protein